VQNAPLRVAGGPGDKQVGAFVGLRGERAIRDLVGVADAPDAAFIEELGGRDGEALDVVASR